MKRKRKQKSKNTFTKIWINRILWVCVIDMQFPYILALCDKTEIAESLAVAIVTEIVTVFVAYLAKSYFETKAEKKQEFEYHTFDSTHSKDEEEE